MRAIADLLELLLPQRCAVCGTDAAALCERCQRAFTGSVLRQPLVGEILAFSCAEWNAETAPALLGLKQRGRTSLAKPLGQALGRTLRTALAEAGPAGPVAVVPIPSRAQSMRARGFKPVELLIRRAGAPVVPMLQFARRVADQRGLSREQRQANLAGALRMRGRVPRGCAGIVLVDDVITTGATLRAGAQALLDASVPVIAAVSLLATRRRHARDELDEINR